MRKRRRTAVVLTLAFGLETVASPSGLQSAPRPVPTAFSFDGLLPALASSGGDRGRADLRTWTSEGIGSWQLAPDGIATTGVTGGPAFLVGPDEHLNATLRARVRVPSLSRLRLGLAAGYRAPLAAEGHAAHQLDFVLVDWAAGQERRAHEGFRVSRFSGSFGDVARALADHRPAAAEREGRVIPLAHVPAPPWTRDEEHVVELVQRRARLRLLVDGVPVVDREGPNAPGRLALYASGEGAAVFRDVTVYSSNVDPVAIAGPDQVLPVADGCRARVRLDASASTDADTDVLTYRWTGGFGVAEGPRPTLLLEPGLHVVDLTVDDGNGGRASDEVEVAVRDDAGLCRPMMPGRSPSPAPLGGPAVAASTTLSQLWPPNHKLKDVGLTVVASDPSGLPPTATVDVFSDEAPGSCHSSDAQLFPNALHLRAERNGSGNGRVYLVLARASGTTGTAHACATVTVPHDQSAASIASVNAQAAAARTHCVQSNGAPAGFVLLASGPFPVTTPSRPIRPVLECIRPLGSGAFEAVFGYLNENPVPVTVPVGAANTLTPLPADRGQPTTFQPGRTPVGQGAFTVASPVPLTWTVKGRSVTATASSPACTLPRATPEARDDVATTSTDTPLAIDVLANDSDPQGDALAVARVTPPSHGTAAIAPDGRVLFTPATGYTGSDTFTYTVSDGSVGTDQAVVTVTIETGNAAPVVDAGPDQTLTLPANAVLLGTATDDGRPSPPSLSVQWTQASGPGAVAFSAPQAVSTQATFVVPGLYTLRFTAADGSLSSSDTLSVTVLAPLAPEIRIEDATIEEGALPLTGAAQVRLTLSSASAVEVTVPYAALAASAVAGCDFLPRTGRARFAPGETATTVNIPVVADLVPEPQELFLVALGLPDNAVVVDDRADVVVIDDDAANQAPLAPTDRQPPDGTVGLPLDPTLGWSGADPDGDPLTYDVYFGTAFGLGGQAWRRECPAGAGPGSRFGAAAAFDEAGDRLIVFGGTTAGVDHGDVWVLEGATAMAGGATWRRLDLSGGPSPRRGAVAAYDAASNRLVVHGGCAGGCDSALADTWVLLHANGAGGSPEWRALPPAPQARTGHGAAYDAAGRRLLVYGGSSGRAGTDLGDVAILHDATGDGTPHWDTLPVEGDAPPARSGAATVFDPAANRLVVTGGRTAADETFDDVWVLAHANGIGGTPRWTRLAPTGDHPAARWGHAAAYDPQMRRLLVFGGSGAGFETGANAVANDLWLLTGADGTGTAEWTHVDPSDGPPPPRLLAAAAYSARAGRMVVAGGLNNRAPADPLDDLWTLDAPLGALPLVAEGHVEPSLVVSTPSATATYFWRVVARDGHGAAAGSPTWRFRPNGGPSVVAGPDHVIDLPSDTVSLDAAAQDDGLPDTLVATWQATAGPAPVFFDDTSALDTVARFTAPGEYVLRLTVNDGAEEASDDVQVTVRPANQPPLASAGADFAVSVDQPAPLAGTVSDDGRPDGSTLTSAWTQVSGPGSAAFANPAAPATTVTLPAQGDYVLRLTASDSALTATDEVTVRAVAGADIAVAAVDASGVSTDGQALTVSGAAVVQLTAPQGAIPQPFTVMVFSDRDGNGRFDAATDSVLGEAVQSGLGLGSTATLAVPVSGSVSFAGDLLHALADSTAAVAEADEGNNYGSSAPPCTPVSLPGFVPVVQWKWSASAVLPEHKQVQMTPAVVDVNADGIPDVVFSTYRDTFYLTDGVLRAVDGRTGSEIFTVTDPARRLLPSAQIAAGDIDNDGRPEIVAIGQSGTLLVFEHDGAFKWAAPLPDPTTWGGPALADLEGDGQPEIVVGRQVFTANGVMRWRGAAGAGDNGIGPLSIVADLDGDGSQDIVAGNTAYRADGSLLWHNAALGDGFPAVGNFDADPRPEVVLVSAGKVYLLDHTGQVSWGPFAIPGGGRGGAPTVADFDGDGAPEIGVAGASRYVVFETDGSVKWAITINDVSSNATGSSVFDFEGDGSAEVVYADQEVLWVFRGSDGTVLHRSPMGSCTAYENPLVVDVDADGSAEIVVPANNTVCAAGTANGIHVFGETANRWVATRRIWNQHSYHITNVTDDARIPAHEEEGWLRFNSYRQNVLPSGCLWSQPDVTASFVRISADGGSRLVTARIGNAGANGVVAGLPVSFYDGDPTRGGERLGQSQTSTDIRPGAADDVTLALPLETITRSTVWVVADDRGALRGTLAEPNEANNIYDSGLALTADAADLTVTGVETASVVADARTAAVSGTVTVRVRNQGASTAGGVTVLCFEDRNASGAFEPQVDLALGTAPVAPTAAGHAAMVGVPIAGELLFAGNRIHAWVDSENTVAEADEVNNVAPSGESCGFQPAPGVFVPREEWAWSASALAPFSLNVAHTPAVLDLDGDGVPDIAFVTYQTSGLDGRLRAVSGADGRELFTVTTAEHDLWPHAEIATGDIDGDGRPEIVAYSETRDRLLAFEHDGTFKWRSDALETTTSAVPSLSDLDGDGTVEIVVGRQVLDAAGVLRWTGTGGRGGNVAHVSVPADLDGDGHPEVVAGNTAYRADGTLLWQNTQVGDGYAVVANFDAHPDPDVMVLHGNRVWLLDRLGRILWGPVLFEGTPFGTSAPAAADLDGDGRAEVVIATLGSLMVFTGTGSLLWKIPAQAAGFGLSGIALFDFDGDGRTEVVYRGASSVRIHRGGDGVLMAQAPAASSGTNFDGPVVADVDGDGNVELLLALSNAFTVGQRHGLLVLGDAGDNWIGARPLWNQHGFRPSSVTDAGRIVGRERSHWDEVQGVRWNAPRRGWKFAAPDVVASRLRKGAAGTSLGLTVRLGNGGGEAAGAGVPISFYDGDPQAAGLRLGTARTRTRITPGAFEDVTLQLPANAQSQNTVWVAADDDGTGAGALNECDEANNVFDSGEPLNAAPTADAGPDQALGLPADTVTLAGTAADDGFPVDSTLSVAWSQVGGPAPVVLGSPNTPSTSARFSAAGAYVLRLTATDGTLSAADEVEVTVTAPNTAPLVDAGADQAITLPPTTTVTLNGTVADDGQPVGAPLSLSWSTTGGPAPVTFSPPTAASTQATFTLPGTYVLRLTATDSELVAFDELTVTVTAGNRPPTVNAGADQAIAMPTRTATLAGTASDDGLPEGSAVSLAWSMAAGPDPVAFATPTAPTTVVTFRAVGTYVLRLTASDGALSASDDVTVVVAPADPQGDGPDVSVTSPSDGTRITAPASVVGSVGGEGLVGWTLRARLVNDTGWTVLATGDSTVTNGALGTFDPSLLINGVYELELRASDTAGRTATTAIHVVVRDQLKVGHFSVGFVDLEVPVAGLPIRVSRLYDSRDKGRGDFGFGWRLEIAAFRLGESATAGRLWHGSVQGTGFLSYCLGPTRPAVVTITDPSGAVHEFEPEVTPSCQFAYPIQTARVTYRPRPGTLGTLVAADGGDVYAFGSWPGPIDLYSQTSLDLFDPQQYRLTLPDGRSFDIHQTEGLRSLRDLNGNTLTITRDGITSANPAVAGSVRGVTFARDAEGSIRAVTDPEGRSISYTYDSAGDLVAVTDREAATTRFAYSAEVPHHLLSIEDPFGRRPIRNEYFPDGRLKSHTDAFGKTITYAHSIAARQEVVTDRLGQVRVLEYDDRGNVLQETQPDGRVVLRTFDERNNRLSETEPHEAGAPAPATTRFTFDAAANLLSATDPLGQRTAYTYNARRQVLTSTDPRGTVTENAYDGVGNLLSTKDGLGHVTAFAYDTRGNVLSQTATVDGQPQVTRYEYDAFGNVTKETDPTGHAVVSVFDRNGNRLSQTTTRTTPAGVETLLTRYEYDGAGRLTKTIAPDGTSTRTVYDALGRQLESFDALGRKTSFTYDDMGRMVKTTFADGTFEESGYDAEGRRTSAKDRAGRTTVFEYDGLGRLRKTTFPDATFTSSEYDAAGRLTRSLDARGQSTAYFYDAAGRRTRVRNALGQETVFAYDAAGNQISVRDPRLNITRFEYDVLGRRTKTIFPDETFTVTTYDTLGRRVAETDQAGRTLQYRYDAAGRLAKVIDALLQETTYGYDELGNRVAQTDALGRTTRFDFDALGRETRRTLPPVGAAPGAFETKQYDAAGNLVARTDFLGRTTTFAHDLSGRPTSRTYPDASQVSFTYSATGRRLTAVDARGTTTYGYDSRDRLATLSYPDGRRLEFAYDSGGNRTKLTAVLTALSLVTNYTFDPLSRLQTVSDPAQRTYTHGYDANGNRASLEHPNGVVTAYTYDALNRLTSLASTHPPSGRTIQSYGFTLGPSGNRTAITEHDGTVRAYGYDALYRLVSERVTLGGPLQYEKTFTYDAVGNRLTQVTVGAGAPGTPTAPGSVAYDYDARDRLLTETLDLTAVSTYEYDANGNVVTRSGDAAYTWDFDDRLVRVAKTDGTVVEHAYDADGNRVRTRVTPPTGPPVVTEFLVDTSGGLSHVVAETDAAGALKAHYVRGDDLLAVMRPLVPAPVTSADWQTRYFHADGIGSIRRLTNEAALITDGYTYTAFGEQIAHTGTDPQPYAFAGEPYDPNSRFQYHRARWMDPRVGRFAGADTFEGYDAEPLSLHKYLYANCDPQNRRDPSGLFTLPDISIGLVVRSVLQTLAISAPLRGLYAAHQLRAGVDWKTVGQELAAGIVSDVATAAILAGVFAYIPRFVSAARAAGQAVERAPSSVWNLGQFDRGRQIEQLILGRPSAFGPNAPVVEEVVEGVAVSIKSIDLTAASYQSTSALRGLMSRYARDLATYTFNAGPVPQRLVSERVLVLAVEEGAATGAQLQAMTELGRLGRYVWPNIKVVFTAIP